MKTFHIYTDASCKNTSIYPCGVKRTVKVGVIVVDSHIIDIYYKRREKFNTSHIAERQAVVESVNYVKSKYKTNNIIVYTDYKTIISKPIEQIKKINKEGIKIKFVKGHCPNRKGLKYKFNSLADWISRNGLLNWRDYYYRHLL